MQSAQENVLKWQRMRERCHIADPQPPPARRKEKAIGDILCDVLKERSSQAASLPAGLAEHWPVIAGSQIAGHTRPAHLSNGLLYIHADHPGWLTQLRRIPKNHLLQKIRAVPDLPAVRDIRFQLDPALRTVPPRRRGKRAGS